MKTSDILLAQAEIDLGIRSPFIKGMDIQINNCWHFSTDGNAVDALFYDETDFRDGMNRIYVVVRKFCLIILAFCLMDNHVHFVLYGDYDECNKFMHEYVRRTSMSISNRHGERNKLDSVPINNQIVDTDRYLKTVICYVIKNPPVAGLPFLAYDYPWSSGALYFRRKGYWTSSVWVDFSKTNNMTGSDDSNIQAMTVREKRTFAKTKDSISERVRIIDGIFSPDEYVAVDLVEKIFRTQKSFNYFLCVSKEDVVESRGGSISRLSLPLQEIRQRKTEVCLELFGEISLRKLGTQERIMLAKTLKARYNCSLKQIARVSGLIYDEVKSLF